MKKIILYSFLLIFINLISFIPSFSEIVNNISVKGNKRILTETIIEYGQINKNKNYSSEDLNIIQKKIFNTGFFEKIELNLNSNTLNINVTENPLINFFSLEGDIDSDDKNKLYDLIKLGQNKIYSEYLLKNDLVFIKDYFAKKGYSGIEVFPRISKLDNNQLNILININKFKEVKINHIFFIGDKKFSTSELLDVITSTQHGWWKFLSSSTIINEDRINYDKELLKKYYLDNGYYDAQITSVNINQLGNSRANITFSINSGILYTFGSFEISEGKNLLTKEVANYIDLLKKKYLINQYSNKNIRNFVNNLDDFISKSKIEFIDTSVSELKNNNKIDLKLIIKQTPKKYVEKINITGNSITEEKVIRRSLAFSEGDSYLEYKKNKSLDIVRSLNIFKDVTFNIKDSENQNVIVDINVIEQPTGSISAGAGYGGDGGLITFGLNERNFLGEGINIDSNVLLGTQRISGSVSTTIPDFQYSENTLYAGVYTTKTSLNNTLYESHKTGLDLSTRYEIYDNIYFKPGLGVDFESINVLSGASSFFQSQDGNYLTEKINYNLEIDKRDKKFRTRNGSILGFNQEVATLGSDVPYLKNGFYGSTFFPASEKQTVNIKYGYSNITTLNNSSVKLSDRLFIPNQYTKGFEPRGFGPKDSASREFIGGNNSFYSNINVSLPNPVQETWNLNTIAFLNAFNVWGTDNSSASNSNNSIRSSIGLGFDWRSPIGPINMSFSKPISKENSDKTKIFSFEIGTVF